MTFPQLDDRNGDIYSHFQVVAQPAFIVIDPTGETQTMLGALDEDTFDDTVTAAIAT